MNEKARSIMHCSLIPVEVSYNHTNNSSGSIKKTIKEIANTLDASFNGVHDLCDSFNDPADNPNQSVDYVNPSVGEEYKDDNFVTNLKNVNISTNISSHATNLKANKIEFFSYLSSEEDLREDLINQFVPLILITDAEDYTDLKPFILFEFVGSLEKPLCIPEDSYHVQMSTERFMVINSEIYLEFYYHFIIF